MFLLKLFFFSDDFTFFVMFNFSYPGLSLVSDCFTKLVSGTPDKPKLGVFNREILADLPETLQVAAPVYNTKIPKLFLQILNKRWQTLDLISMMGEFKRAVRVMKGLPKWPLSARKIEEPCVTITDSLSSLPRFKRKEELSVSQ